MNHEFYMRRALALAEEAMSHGDVPVGCVITDEAGVILGEGRNRRQISHDATAHAEVQAIREACGMLGSWRLRNATLYVTLEPCPMCAGAIINARIGTIRYGAREEQSGCCGSVLNLFEERFHHHPKIYGGLLEAECAGLLRMFFQTLRPDGGVPAEPQDI
ncbi:MAG: tRNA-specific adenosine-34 deaminase [Oscillospiraceae bacterium]|nr:tRNA-specific adenosine-34 deaminase [Oscillospiraceae bacterium]